MALSGSKSIWATPNYCDTLVFSWEASQDRRANTSTINWTMNLVASEKYGLIYGVYEQKDWSVTIDGQETTGKADINIDYGETKTLASGTTIVNHESDGSKTFEFSFGINMDITWGSSSETHECPECGGTALDGDGNECPICNGTGEIAGSSGTYIGWRRDSGSGELDVITKSFDTMEYINGYIMGICAPARVFSKYEQEPEQIADPYLTFTSDSPFTTATANSKRNWDGTLEYSTNTTDWNVWDGTEPISSMEYNGTQSLYIRGIDNHTITDHGSSSGCRWVLDGASGIYCTGNVETLLNYSEVVSGIHPDMDEYCFAYMFNGCLRLMSAPELPAETLSDGCYFRMFEGCHALTEPPELPALTLKDKCYFAMFQYCYALSTPPELNATTLATGCYDGMFSMCKSLTSAPKLPATTLEPGCYADMFYGCASLTNVPELPATTLPDQCYYRMFYSCSGIKLSATGPSDEYPTPFTISTTGTAGANSLTNMFSGTTGNWSGTPEPGVTYYGAWTVPAPVDQTLIPPITLGFFMGNGVAAMRQSSSR